MKDEKSAANFHYIKTVSGKVVAYSIAFRVVSNILAGGRPLPPEILPSMTCPLLSMVSYGRCQNS